MTEQGVATDPAKVERVLNWPVPESSTEVKSFLRLASYYRRFVAGFASIARPRYQLTEPTKEFEWTNECQIAFDQLKEPVISRSVAASEQVVVDDGLIRFPADEEPSLHRSDAEPEVSVAEVEGGEGGDTAEQKDRV